MSTRRSVDIERRLEQALEAAKAGELWRVGALTITIARDAFYEWKEDLEHRAQIALRDKERK